MEVPGQPAGLTLLLVGPWAPIQVFRLGSKHLYQLSNATFSVMLYTSQQALTSQLHGSWGSTGLDSGEPLVMNLSAVDVSAAVLQQPCLSVLLLKDTLFNIYGSFASFGMQPTAS